MHHSAIQNVQAKAYYFEDDGQIPNNPLPLLLYPAALIFGQDDPAATCETIFRANGWGGTWRNGIYPYHHYHSTAHEVLALSRGQAEVQLGGEQGITVALQAGDVVLIPAGVGHKNLGNSRNLLVIGAYPAGQQWDLCRGEPGERPRVLQNIANVPLPDQDPIYGDNGPMHEHWQVES